MMPRLSGLSAAMTTRPVRGVKQEVFASSIAGVYQGRRQNIAAGSYVSVPINPEVS